MVEEQVRYEQAQQAQRITAANLGMHGDPKDVRAEIKRLTS